MSSSRPRCSSGRGHSVDDVIARIDAVSRFTPAEAQVADLYLQSLPGAAFLNLEQVSRTSGVSTATVTRFARRLGFTDFREMRSWLMEGARGDLEHPQDRRSERSTTGHTALTSAFARAEADLHASAASIDAEGFERTTALVADETRPLYLAAVASGQPLMAHVALLLGYLRGDVHVLDGVDRWPHQLAGLDERSVVLAAAYDRDPLPLLGLLQLARDAGSTSVMITNRHRSPLLRMADIGLSTTARRGAMFGSRVSTLCVLEALVDAVSEHPGRSGARAEAIERGLSTLSVHADRG